MVLSLLDISLGVLYFDAVNLIVDHSDLDGRNTVDREVILQHLHADLVAEFEFLNVIHFCSPFFT